ILCSWLAPVKTAFLDLALLPPPAPRARILTRLCRPRAGGASDGGETRVVQRVIGDVAVVDVFPNLLRGPGGQRRDLRDSAVLQIGRNDGGLSPSGDLGAAQSRHPCVVAGERALERPRLAHAAAQAAQVG